MSIKKNTKKFKYKVVPLITGPDLQVYGADGWELVAVSSTSMYFKMEV